MNRWFSTFQKQSPSHEFRHVKAIQDDDLESRKRCYSRRKTVDHSLSYHGHAAEHELNKRRYSHVWKQQAIYESPRYSGGDDDIGNVGYSIQDYRSHLHHSVENATIVYHPLQSNADILLDKVEQNIRARRARQSVLQQASDSSRPVLMKDFMSTYDHSQQVDNEFPSKQALLVRSDDNRWSNILPKDQMGLNQSCCPNLKFSGRSKDWRMFAIDLGNWFRSRPHISMADRLEILYNALDSESQNLIANVGRNNEKEYTRAVYLLCAKHDNEYAAIGDLLADIDRLPKLQSMQSTSQLNQLLTTLRSVQCGLDSFNVSSKIIIDQIVPRLLELLPPEMDILIRTHNPTTLKDYIRILEDTNAAVITAQKERFRAITAKKASEEQLEARSNDSRSRSPLTVFDRLSSNRTMDHFDAEDQESIGSRRSRRSNSRLSKRIRPSKRHNCRFCDGSHKTSICTSYTNASVRIQRAKQLALCMRCLNPNHRLNECVQAFDCVHCGENHFSYMCEQNYERKQSKRLDSCLQSVPKSNSAKALDNTDRASSTSPVGRKQRMFTMASSSTSIRNDFASDSNDSSISEKGEDSQQSSTSKNEFLIHNSQYTASRVEDTDNSTMKLYPKMLRVLVNGPKGSKVVHAVIDETVTCSFVSHSLCNRLGLELRKPLMKRAKANETNSVNSLVVEGDFSKEVTMRLASVTTYHTQLLDCYVANKIQPPKCLPLSEEVRELAKSKDVDLNLVHDGSKHSIDILFGEKFFSQLGNNKLVKLSDSLMAICTTFGWCVRNSLDE